MELIADLILALAIQSVCDFVDGESHDMPYGVTGFWTLERVGLHLAPDYEVTKCLLPDVEGDSTKAPTGPWESPLGI